MVGISIITLAIIIVLISLILSLRISAKVEKDFGIEDVWKQESDNDRGDKNGKGI